MVEKTMLDATEVAKHNTTSSCWVILYGNVYDVTDFLPSHPGGEKVILQLAGKDATEDYDPIHPTGTLESALSKDSNLGFIDPETLKKTGPALPVQGLDIAEAPLDTLLNLDDFEAVAKRKLSEKAWAYYYSAADDLVSKSLNSSAYRQILFRPRVFIDVAKVDTSTTLLGHKVSLPIYVSPAAMARLGHPSGEHGIARACGVNDVIQLVSNNASQTVEEIVSTPSEGQIWGFQLYVQTTASKSEEMLRRVEATGRYKFIVLTLDAPTPGKREDDERAKNAANGNVTSAVGTGSGAAGGGGLGKALFAGTSASLTWKTTIPWLSKSTTLPIVLKGLQCWEDAKLASETKGVKAIILSNHGGRSLDGAPPAVYTLLEMRRYCPEVFDKLEVWIDGGVKRGSDVVKALCLGARGVGIGRAALFGLSVGGPEGVERVIQILREEIETDMRLLGVCSIKDLGMQHVNTRALDPLIWDGGDILNCARAKI